MKYVFISVLVLMCTACVVEEQHYGENESIISEPEVHMNETTQEAKEVISSAIRDEYGCLENTTYRANLKICMKNWELDLSAQEALHIAVQEIGEQKGLTLEKLRLSGQGGSYQVFFRAYDQKITVILNSWEVISVQKEECYQYELLGSQEEVELCDTCGDGICGVYEQCTPLKPYMSSCGPLYCPEDCVLS